MPPRRRAAERVFDETLGSRIRERRTALGLSQAEVAARLGVSFQQVQKYENGQNRISGARLTALAAVLHVAPAWLFEQPEAAPEAPGADRLLTEHQRRFAALPRDIQNAIDNVTRELVRLRGRERGS